MLEYLQVIGIVPGFIFYILKWTSIIWGPFCLLTPFIYQKIKGANFRYQSIFWRISVLALYMLTRFLMSGSNLPMNSPQAYKVNLLEAGSFTFTVLYAFFFFLDQKKNFIKRDSDDKVSFYLGLAVIFESVVSLFNLYISGYGISFS